MFILQEGVLYKRITTKTMRKSVKNNLN